jgi:hypothetical protein
MITTNTASSSLPITYMTLRTECEALLETAIELEKLAHTGAGFLDHPKFRALKQRLAAHAELVCDISNL